MLHDETDQRGMIEYAWHHAVISDEVYNAIKRWCNFSESDPSDACGHWLDEYFSVYDLIDMYSLYAPTCIEGSSTSRSRRKIKGAAPKFMSKFVCLSSLFFFLLGSIFNTSYFILFDVANKIDFL